MPNVTEAEKALLDAAITQDGALSELRTAVLMERGDPVLFEAAVEAEVARYKAERLAKETAEAFVAHAGHQHDRWDLIAKVRSEARARLSVDQ